MKITLRTHQEQAYDSILERFQFGSKALLKMFCGSGKTRVAFKLLVERKRKLSVIAFPSIALIDQFNLDYLLNDTWAPYLQNISLLSICSRKEFHEKNHIRYCTDEKTILNFLQADSSEFKICCVTYQSFPTLMKCLPVIDFIVYDEAHHILGEKIQQIVFDDTFCPKHSLFMTATPKNQNGIYMVDEGDHTSVCGPIVYKYTHAQGVQDLILNGFHILIDLFIQSEQKDETETEQSVYESICRAVLQTGNNRVLTFHSRSETEHSTRTNVVEFVHEKVMKTAFQKVLKTEFPELKNKYKHLHFKGITAGTRNKRTLLENFDQCPDNEIYILASCKTINEGIDTKNANMCVFVDPKNSPSDIIQNIGRITRLPRKDISFATVLLPCGVDATKYSASQTREERDAVIREDMNTGGNFSSILHR